MAVTRLIYFSENRIDPDTGSVVRQLGNILEASTRNNKSLGLTGALVFDGMWFLQALEGPRNAVWQTFKRIEHDERHSNVMLIEVTDVPQRVFGNWWMGLAQMDAGSGRAYKPYLQDGKLNPHDMTAQQVLALMIDLSKIGLSRELVPPMAS